MKKLTPIQIQAGDEILKECDSNGSASPFRLFGRSNDNSWGWEIDDITNAGDFLMNVSVIKRVSDRVKEGGVEYMFTTEGEESYQKGKRTIDYVNEEAEKVAEQQRKDERDDKTKDAQLQKLEAELLVLKDMQAEQRTFWQSGIARQKQQRVEFWITFLLAAGGFLLGIINFVKSIVLPKL